MLRLIVLCDAAWPYLRTGTCASSPDTPQLPYTATAGRRPRRGWVLRTSGRLRWPPPRRHNQIQNSSQPGSAGLLRLLALLAWTIYARARTIDWYRIESGIAVGGFLSLDQPFAPTKAFYDAFVHGGGMAAAVASPKLSRRSQHQCSAWPGLCAGCGNECFELVPTIWCAASPIGH